MRIADLNGNWVGLAYVDEYPYNVDNFSTPDGWNIGFDIVYRLIFIFDASQNKDERLREGFREAFRKAFNLTDNHYETQQWPDEAFGSVFWRIYWDRQAFDLRLLKKCEENLDECAELNKAKVLLLDMVIVPRSNSYIAQLIKQNSPPSKSSSEGH